MWYEQSLCTLLPAAAAPWHSSPIQDESLLRKHQAITVTTPHLLSATGPHLGRPLTKVPMGTPHSRHREVAMHGQVLAAWCWAHLVES